VLPSRPPPPAARHVLAIAAGAVGIAFAPIFTKLAMQHGGIGPTAAAFWRLALATPLLLLLWWRLAAQGREAPGGGAGPTRNAGTGSWLALMWPGLLFAGDLAIWHASLRYTSAANSTLLANCATIIVSLVGWLWLRERLTWVFVAGAALALSGVVGVLNLDWRSGGQAARGDVLALAAAVFYAAYLLNVKVLRRDHGVLSIMAVSTAVSTVLLLPASVLLGERLICDSAVGWMSLAGLALVSHCAGQGLIAWALAHLPVSFSSVTLLIQPVGAALLAWPILGERVGLWQGIGAAAVLAGIFLARQGSR
jgi:drug/metabolite transporter (DMT)-like permease